MRLSRKYVFEQAPPGAGAPRGGVSVVTGRAGFNDFFSVPWAIYRGDRFWVPPLSGEFRDYFRRDNPFWGHACARLFVAYREGLAVGRVAAVIDRNFSGPGGRRTGFFGFFEAAPGPGVSGALLRACGDWLAANGMTVMLGPINGRVEAGCGFLLEGPGTLPFMLSPYSPRYYIDSAESFGMKKSKDLLSFHIDLRKGIPEPVRIEAERCMREGVRVRPFDAARIGRELEWWPEMIRSVFSGHWGYSDASTEEVAARVRKLRRVIDPKLFLVAEVGGRPVGFRWAMPDYNPVLKKLDGRIGLLGVPKFLWHSRSIKRGKFIIMGIEREYRGKGIGTTLNYHALVEMKSRGYESAEYGWIDEKNIASQRAAEKIGGVLYRRHRVYEVELELP